VLEQFFYISSGTTMIAAVLLTMRSIAEERQTGTDVLLHTAPISEGQIIFGKYLAAMAVLSLMTVLTVYMPALIFVNGKVSYAHIAVGYLGLLSLGSATISIGIFGSSLFKSQLAAAFVAGVIVVTMLLFWMISEVTEAPFTDVLAYAALFDKHFVPFEKGRLLTSGLVFYGSLSFGFLTLATRVLEGRRWK
jgi:ABC-2 type transport system permease protein